MSIKEQAHALRLPAALIVRSSMCPSLFLFPGIFVIAPTVNEIRSERVWFVLRIPWETLLLFWDGEGEQHLHKTWQEVATPSFHLLFWPPLLIFVDFYSGKRIKMRNCLRECSLGFLPSLNWKIAQAKEMTYSVNPDLICV